jgi:hypothetical protein
VTRSIVAELPLSTLLRTISSPNGIPLIMRYLTFHPPSHLNRLSNDFGIRLTEEGEFDLRSVDLLKRIRDRHGRETFEDDLDETGAIVEFEIRRYGHSADCKKSIGVMKDKRDLRDLRRLKRSLIGLTISPALSTTSVATLVPLVRSVVVVEEERRSTPLSTFNLHASEAQSEERNKVPLPWNVMIKEPGEFRIEYDIEKEDDFDEEEDEDLDGDLDI